MANALPHYSNSRIALNKLEPVYQNLFEVIIDLPPPLQSKYPESYIWYEQIKKVGGLETDKISAVGAEQSYKFATRRFAKSKPDSTVVDLEMDFDVNLSENNQMYPYNVFRDWSHLIYDPMTGKQSLKRDYCGSMVCLWHNKDGQVFRKWIFPTIWIGDMLNAPELDYESEDVFVLTVTFAADFWEDLVVESQA